MELYIILALVITAITAIFAVQNAQIVTVTFLFWSFEASLIVFLLVFFASGIMATLLLTLPRRLKKRRAYEARIRALEDEIAQAKKTATETRSPLPG